MSKWILIYLFGNDLGLIDKKNIRKVRMEIK